MPIKIQSDLPVKEILEQENIFVMDDTRAMHQDIRPIQILILNLMPLKEETELQLLRSLSNTPLQIDVTFMAVASHEAKNTSRSHLNKFYISFEQVKEQKFDGMIITGAPVEQMEFGEVDYWEELTEIMEWSKSHVTSTIHLCWGAQAGLYYHCLLYTSSRTGLINPVAIFTPVELEGSTVSRASVHNISIMRKLELGIGDRIRVYKANMIIPQIGENLTKSGVKDIPSTCPACGGKTVIEKVNDVEALYCRNPECPAKAIKGFTLFVSRDAMNIDGLSEATLEKFIARGFIKNFGDIFEIGKHKDEIIRMEGFGEKSYENLIESLKRAKKTELPRVLYALGIPNIGLANAKMICKELNYDMEKIRYASEEELAAIDGIGPVIAKSFVNYFKKEGTQEKLDHLLSHLEIEAAPKQVETQIFENMNFVITGSVEHFANRKEVKEEIEKRGGKVTGSVTSKTSYLINNCLLYTSRCV